MFEVGFVKMEEIVKSDVLEKRVETAESFAEVLERKVEEADELSELCLSDKKEAEEKYRNLNLDLTSNYGKYVRRISGLPKNIREFLWEIVPKSSSEREPNEKIVYQRMHDDPKGLERFLKKLSKCEWINEIHTGSQIYKGQKKNNFKNPLKENGYFIIEGVYVEKNIGKSIFIHTTAENENQALFMKCYLDENF